MGKTRFSDSKDNVDRDIAKAEGQRADAAARALTQMKQRINTFFNDIDHVVFASEKTAPVWAEGWYAFLLSGTLLPKPEVELEIVEETVEGTVEETGEVDAESAVADDASA